MGWENQYPRRKHKKDVNGASIRSRSDRGPVKN